MEAPKKGEDCRTLHRYVDQLVKETNALINMAGVFDARTRGIMGTGFLRLIGNMSELRIRPLGGDVEGEGDTRQLTTLILHSSHNPSDFGETVTFTGSVAPDATGTMTFFNNGVPFGVVTVVGGVGVALLVNPPSGNHAITLNYSGDFRYFPATVTLVQRVNSLNPPIIACGATPNPAVKGIDYVTFIGDVTTQNPVPPAPELTGTVDFYIDGSFFHTRPLVFLRTNGDGTKTYRADTSDDPINYLSFGDHEILARYSGDNHYGTAEDTVTLREILQPTVTLTIEPNPVNTNETVTLTATISQGQGPMPTGTVQFSDENGNIGGPVPVVSGVATLSAGSGPVEQTAHVIAHYSGDQWHSDGDSNTVVLQIVNEANAYEYGVLFFPNVVNFGQATTCQIKAYDQFNNFDPTINGRYRFYGYMSFHGPGNTYYASVNGGTFQQIPDSPTVPTELIMVNGIITFSLTILRAVNDGIGATYLIATPPIQYVPGSEPLGINGLP